MQPFLTAFINYRVKLYIIAYIYMFENWCKDRLIV